MLHGEATEEPTGQPPRRAVAVWRLPRRWPRPHLLRMDAAISEVGPGTPTVGCGDTGVHVGRMRGGVAAPRRAHIQKMGHGRERPRVRDSHYETSGPTYEPTWAGTAH